MKWSRAYLISPDFSCLLSVIHRLVKGRYGRYRDDAAVGDFFSFMAVTRFVACLTPISGCVFVCLFAKAQPEVCVVCGFSKALIRSTTEAKMAECNPKVSLLILACSPALDSVKTGRSKVSGFMSTISHEESAPRTREKMSDSMCFAEATRARRMLVVLMVWNNVRSVSHGAAAWCIVQHSCESLSLSFSPSLFLSVSHFLSQLTFVYVLFVLWDSHLYDKTSRCLTAISTTSFFLSLKPKH